MKETYKNEITECGDSFAIVKHVMFSANESFWLSSSWFINPDIKVLLSISICITFICLVIVVVVVAVVVYFE